MDYKLKTFLHAHWTWYVTHPWEFFSDLYKEIKSFLQRGWRGYADSDTWGFDWYLTHVLAGGLRKFSKQEMSYPGCGKMDTFKKWQYAVKSNAKRFENVLHYEEIGWEKDKDYKKSEKVYKEQDKALKFLKEWFNQLWW